MIIQNFKVLDRRRKLSFFGHIYIHDGLERDLLLGMVFGGGGRVRLKTRYSDNIKERIGGKGIVVLSKLAQDGGHWRCFTEGHGRSAIDLSAI